MIRSTRRLVYLDWLRGIAVLIMVLAHVVDSWTRAEDRRNATFYQAVFVGGVGAPLFLFLAGVAVVLSAHSRSRAAGDPGVGARAALARGAEVFVLGLLFRLQSQLLGWGPLTDLFKVDILNIMGLSMMTAALVWGAARTRALRIAAFGVLTGLATLATPMVREVGALGALPDPLEAYLRPEGRYAAFTLFPWAGFLLAGALVGELIDAAREPRAERRLQAALFGAGVGGALVAWWASFQPSIYPKANFWTSSPTFFFIRLGIITALVPAGWAHCRFWLGASADAAAAGAGQAALWRRAPVRLTRAVETLGRSSLFVYWIHVEMVYGVIAEPIKQTLPLWGSLAATAALWVLLHALVVAKNGWMSRHQLPGPMRVFATVLR